MNRHTDNEISEKEYRKQGQDLSSHNLYTKASMKFNSQLNTSGHEPKIFDTPVSHSIDIPTEELKSIVITGTLVSSHNTHADSQAYQQSNQHHIHTYEQTH